jgi:hypothetical protein
MRADAKGNHDLQHASRRSGSSTHSFDAIRKHHCVRFSIADINEETAAGAGP